MRRGLGVVLAVLLAVGLAGCGVPVDTAPRALEPSDAPPGVFDALEEPQEGGDVEVQLWFVSGDRVVPTRRRLELPGTPQRMLQALFAGPTSEESETRLTTNIPTNAEIDRVEVEDGVAVVTLEQLDESVPLRVAAVAQIVATLTEHPSVTAGVRFRADDADLSVPKGDGERSSAPVTRQDYAQLLGPSPASVSPAPVPPEASPDG